MKITLRIEPRALAPLLCLLALGPPAVAQGDEEPWPPDVDTLTPAASAALLFEKGCRAFNSPGASVAVAQDGKIVFSMGFGFAELDNLVPATSSTVYNIGSVSKVMTGVAVMQLVEVGVVGLDDDIRRYVPSFPDKGNTITLWHLMTHTSGIRHYVDSDFPDGLEEENVQPWPRFEDAVGIFKDDPLLFEPGEYYSYSSFGINLLQGVIETASGLGFEEYMRQRVWGPAGMLRTAFDVPERIVPGRARSYLVEGSRVTNHPYGDVTYKFASGGMISTVEDLVRFGHALNGGHLLKPETLRLIREPQLEGVPELVPRVRARPRQQGLVCELATDERGRPYLWHGGSVKGFGAGWANFYEDDVIVAIAGNSYEVPAAESVIADFFLSAGDDD